jgi:hypothetical protein
MFEHLGEEVNVVLHDGSSYWRRLVGVSQGKILLGGPKLLTIQQEEIRSFGTEEDGILQEVEI